MRKELREFELESVTGGVRIRTAGGSPVIGKQMLIVIEGQEYKVKTDQEGVVRLPLFIGDKQAEFKTARARLLDEACED